ncbi:MAG: tRNA pseudouridine(55) synthase TruB [Betaproteobacteria bacterium]
MKHGVLLLDKPSGISSNAALQRVRRMFDWSKAGHTGTLDPLATGLLPVCLGEATKFSHSMLDADKGYDASIRLGFCSSTGDAEGEIEARNVPAFADAELQEVLRSFVGPIDQIPPMHSALKRDGKPLYAYARAGETLVREPRRIIINSLQYIDLEKDVLKISVSCSKGTYIRVLASDIGDKLGCGAYLLALRRTEVGDLALREASTLDELAEMDPADRDARLLPVDRLVQNLPAVHLDSDASLRIINGLRVSTTTGQGVVRLYDPSGAFMGVGETRSDGSLVSKRLVSQARPAGQLPVDS